MPEAQVNFFCPEQRASFMRRPCEGFWAKIAEAREKWPNHQFNFPLNKCDGCKGDKLVPPEKKEQQMPMPEELGKSKMIRTKILDQLDKMIPTLGPSVTKKDLATALNISVVNLSYHLAKMHGHGLVKITSPGDGFPDQISWPAPKDAPLPDKVVDVQEKEEMPENVIQKGEKVETVQEVPEVPEAPEDPNPPDLTEVPHLPEATEVRLCKNNDGRPAHKLSPYCLECCQENLKKNQMKGKEKPKASDTPAHEAEEKLFNWTLDNLPVFDPTWTQEVYERWAKLHGDLMEMAKRLDGEGIA